MSFPLYPNTTAGLASIGPVQAMSDRNLDQTLMANNGQMFAGGGITKLAKGGLPKFVFDPKTQQYVITTEDTAEGTPSKDLLPKYIYDPKTQRYTLLDPKTEAPKNASPLESTGGDSSSGGTSAFDNMSNADKAAYYAANPNMAAITQAGQSAFGALGLGQLAAYMDPQAYNESLAVAKGFDPSQTTFGRGAGSFMGMFGSALEAPMSPEQLGYGSSGYGFSDPMNDGGGSRGPLSGEAWGGGLSNLSSGYESVGGGDTYSSPSADTSAETNSFESAYGYAAGGISALARGGPSHLGDYSDGGRLLRGPGDGVSDSIPATIANKRPARLADGEFVVPARIVSELGNGSTEAGARKLYAMMDRIQKARKKSVGKNRVAVNSRADKHLPA